MPPGFVGSFMDVTGTLILPDYPFMTRMKTILFLLAVCGGLPAWPAFSASLPSLLNDPVDISGDFHGLENFYYLADRVTNNFDPATHAGKLVYQRSEYLRAPCLR